MKTKSFKTATILLLISMVFPLMTNAQRTLNATGGSGSIAGNVFSYSIGEMILVSTVETPTLIVTQGLLQSKVMNMGVEENNLLEEGMSVYPNPVANILVLQPKLQGGGELSVKLFDLRGRLIMQRETVLHFGQEKQQLNLSALQEGTYLLQARLDQDGKVYKHNFKVIKFSDQ